MVDNGIVLALPQGDAALEHAEPPFDLAVGAKQGVAEQREMIVGEPAQERRALGIAAIERGGILDHRRGHPGPVGNRRACVAEHVLKLAL